MGLYQTVVVNLGLRDNISVGNILEIEKEGKVVIDHNEAETNFAVKLLDERNGLLMIIRTYEKMSFGLIMQAESPIHINDMVKTP